jgi:hypothetical protein
LDPQSQQVTARPFGFVSECVLLLQHAATIMFYRSIPNMGVKFKPLNFEVILTVHRR